MVSIEESKDTGGISLVVHEQKLKRLPDANRGRGRGLYHRRGLGKGRQSFKKAIVECFKCYNLGYFQYESSKRIKEANYAKLDYEEEELLLMASIEEN
ncbi:hypothetical protein CR513_60356, partial [Mucuna pruriens]